MLEVGQYRRGDLASLPRSEPDPFEWWPEYTEHMAHDLRSIRLCGDLVAVIGYFAMDGGQALSFAVIDRVKAAGSGKQLVKVSRSQLTKWMDDTGVAEAHADCPNDDTAAKVFLRAVGYRRADGDDPDRTFFVLRRG